MGLDDYGFPATIIANSILLEQDDFGDSVKDVEESWSYWLHYFPFDAVTAERLSSLMMKRLARMDVKKDGARRQLLERKLELASQRAERYRKGNFAR